MDTKTNTFQIGEKVYLRKKDYYIFLGLDSTAPWYDVCEVINFENEVIIQGFQNPAFDERDVIVRWKDFLWDTTIPSQFLIKRMA